MADSRTARSAHLRMTYNRRSNSSSVKMPRAMKTWRIRLVDQAGGRVSAFRAALRYLLAWMWFAPALLTLQFTGLGGSGASAFVALLAGVVGYAALAWLHPDRQYWHDAVCRTRLVNWLPPQQRDATLLP